VTRTPQIWLILILLCVSCQSGTKLENKELAIIEFLRQNPRELEHVLVLDTISGFEWEEIILAGPYSDFKEIENHTEYDLKIFPNTIKSHDHYIFIGFIDNKKGLHYMEIPISLLPDNVHKSPGKNYKFYPRKNSNLDF